MGFEPLEDTLPFPLKFDNETFYLQDNFSRDALVLLWGSH